MAVDDLLEGLVPNEEARPHKRRRLDEVDEDEDEDIFAPPAANEQDRVWCRRCLYHLEKDPDGVVHEPCNKGSKKCARCVRAKVAEKDCAVVSLLISILVHECQYTNMI